MKKLITAIVFIALLSGVGWTQNELETVGDRIIFTIDTADDLYDSTVFIDMRDLWTLGKFLLEVYTDSIAGFPDGFDSTQIRYRHGYREGATQPAYFESDGAAMDLEYLQIYDGGTTFSDFDWDVTSVDARRFWCAIEQGGIPWLGGVLLNVQHADSNASPADTGRVIITVYRTKH